MTTYNDLVADVVEITNRPDLVGEMRVAIRKAIFKFHLSDTFKRDLRQVNLNMSLYPSVNNRWEIDLSNQELFPRYRRYYSLRTAPVEGAQTTGWQGRAPFVFEPIDAEAVLDSYGIEKQNYFYQLGSSLILRTFRQWDQQMYQDNQWFLQFLYFAFPGFAVSSGNVTIDSWIANQFQSAIAEEAAAGVFKMIGKDEEHNVYRALFAENLQMVRGIDVGDE